MRWRGLLVCTVVVVAAHGALIETMAGHGLQPSPGSASSDAQRRPPARLTLLDREQVASLAPPQAEVPAEPASQPTQAETPAASAPDKPADQASSADPAAGSHAQRATTTIYRKLSQLDVAPRPRSAPEIQSLNGLAWSGAPIRLRLFIDDQGNVVDTQVLQSAESDDVIALVRQVFKDTAFTPGIEHGQAVPCYKDIEITVGKPP